MQNKIKDLIQVAINAPSGDNSQPWHFEYGNDCFYLFNLPDKDNKIFNYKQRGSYIAHGALLKNIELLAPVFGLKIRITLFPGPQNMVAKIETTSTEPRHNNELLRNIKNRCTNRKKYLDYKLTDLEKNTIFSSFSNQNSPNVVFTENKTEISILAKAASAAENTMLQYKPLHDAFFSKIAWNKEEEHKNGRGMLIDALELLPPEKLIFKWFSHWKPSLVLRLAKIPDFVALENSKKYASASAIAAITINNTNSENYIETGMVLQDIWIKCTSLNLSLQPIAGIIYLNSRLQANEIQEPLSKKLTQLIQNSANKITQTFSKNKNQHVSMLFRIGKSDAPSAISSKFYKA